MCCYIFWYLLSLRSLFYSFLILWHKQKVKIKTQSSFWNIITLFKCTLTAINTKQTNSEFIGGSASFWVLLFCLFGFFPTKSILQSVVLQRALFCWNSQWVHCDFSLSGNFELSLLRLVNSKKRTVLRSLRLQKHLCKEQQMTIPCNKEIQLHVIGFKVSSCNWYSVKKPCGYNFSHLN